MQARRHWTNLEIEIDAPAAKAQTVDRSSLLEPRIARSLLLRKRARMIVASRKEGAQGK
jgi:hypothetical protein